MSSTNLQYQTEKPAFDEQKAEKFADSMVAMLNAGAMALVTSIGHKTGLFDVLSQVGPITSEELAHEAGLNERYVREWLGAMVTGRYVDYAPQSQQYHLPAEHAAFLTREATPDNIAVFAQYIPLLGRVEDEIIECFHNGGGVPYSKFPCFHHVMAEDSGQTVLSSLTSHILPLAPGILEQLEHGIDVLDVGCGRGLALISMAEQFPNSRFSGYDFSEQAIAKANDQVFNRDLENIVFEVKDAALIDEVQQYDLITTFDAIHDQKSPAIVLNAIERALRDNGTYLMQDIAASTHVHKNMDHPIAPLLYTLSTMHCMTVSLAEGGDGLGTMWGEELALQMLDEAGFKNVNVHKLEHDFQNNYYIVRKK